jgi:hypothetical protein
MVTLLLQHVVRISAMDKGGGTPLHYAAYKGHAEIALQLLAKGADVQSKNNNARIPEELATAQSHVQIAAMIKAETVRRVKCVAFAMGQQERLGAGSRVQWLDPGVVRMVLEQV